MTSTMSSGTKLVKQDKITYWMDPNEHLSGTSVNDIHASNSTTSWNNATLTNATHSSDNQGVYSMSSGGKIQFPTSDIGNNPFRALWRSDSGTLDKTVSAWVYCTSGEGVDIFESAVNGVNYSNITFRFRVMTSGKLRMYLENIPSNASPADGYYESTNSIVDYDAWTYITMTTQDNGGTGAGRWMNFKFYKNGVLVDDSPTRTFTNNSGWRAHPSESWYIDGVSITRLFEGDNHKAGPLYVHDVTLTAAEIKRNYMQHKSRFQEM